MKKLWKATYITEIGPRDEDKKEAVHLTVSFSRIFFFFENPTPIIPNSNNTLDKIPIIFSSAIEMPIPTKQIVPKSANDKKKKFMFSTPFPYNKNTGYSKVLQS